MAMEARSSTVYASEFNATPLIRSEHDGGIGGPMNTTSSTTTLPPTTPIGASGGLTSSSSPMGGGVGGGGGGGSGGLVGSSTLTGIDLSTRLGRRLIVLAMDDSFASQTALAWTLKQMVHPERDHLVIVTVAHYKTSTNLLRVGRSPQPDEKTTKRELKAENRAQRVCDYAAAHIATWCRDLGVHLSHEIVSLKAADNYVPEVLTDYVRDVNANLLILGSHSGQSTMKRAILGSTSNFCLQHSSVPVIVVREDGAVKAG